MQNCLYTFFFSFPGFLFSKNQALIILFLLKFWNQFRALILLPQGCVWVIFTNFPPNSTQLEVVRCGQLQVRQNAFPAYFLVFLRVSLFLGLATFTIKLIKLSITISELSHRLGLEHMTWAITWLDD